MCLAIPSLVERIDGQMAVVSVDGQRREVSLMLLDEAVAVGDYLLVQNGCFAYERLPAKEALATLALIDEVVAEHDGADLRAW